MPLPLPTIEVTPAVPVRGLGLLTGIESGPWDIPDVHVETAGAQFEAEACTPSRLYPTPCRDVAYDAFNYDAREALRTVYAFNVYASEICTPVGTSVAEAHARVNRRLELGEQAAVEMGLWGGNGSNVVGVFELMQGAGQITAVGTTPGVVEGLALLEQTAKAAYDGPILIHARPMMAPYFAARGLIDSGPASLTPRGHHKTHNGSTYIFGNGYPGNTPAGVAPSTTVETVYATGRVFVWRSAVRSPDNGDSLLNRVDNQRRIFAVRTYALSVECIAVATTITRANF